MKYHEMLNEHKKKAESAKPRLLSLNPAALAKAAINTVYENKSEFIVAMEVKRYFDEAVFFHDKETLKKLKDLNFEAYVTRWFVPLEEIHEQYKNIRAHNVKIDPLLAFTLIKSHLTLKFDKEMLLYMTPKQRGGDNMTELTNDLINLKGRRKYSASDPIRYKNAYEVLLNSQVNEFIKISDDYEDLGKLDINTFIQLSRAKTETIFLKKLVEECFQNNEKAISKRKLLSILYDLFRVLLKDRNLPNKSDFDENYSEKTYRNFDAFKTKTLLPILYPKG